MKTNLLHKSTLFGVALLAGSMGLGATAAATDKPMKQPDTRVFTTGLTPLNGTNDQGQTIVEVKGDQATFKVNTTGTTPNLPHLQHVHLEPTAAKPGFCPDISADTNNDGLISALEGVPSYGPVQISMTTTGDSGQASGLALERFPISNENGEVTYQRTVTLPDSINADNIADGVVVQHGIAELFDDPSVYDGEKPSSLDPTLPLEASVPASCGALTEITETVVTPPVDDEAPVDEEAPMDENNGQDDAVVMPVAPMVNAGSNEDTAAFQASIENELSILREAGNDNAANQFDASFAAATSQFEQKLAAAANKYNSSEEESLQVAKNQYIDNFNNAKAAYFNQLEVAKNQLASELSGQDDVARNMFINEYNQARGVYGNQLEMLKNSFAAKF